MCGKFNTDLGSVELFCNNLSAIQTIMKLYQSQSSVNEKNSDIALDAFISISNENPMMDVLIISIHNVLADKMTKE